METVGTRDLKQNPQAVVRRVLDTGEPLEITTHGHPTGVRLVPDAPARRTWVRGADLGRIRPMGRDAAERLHDDLAHVGDDEPTDPWETRA
ncbi:type II toxin-antitoxin system Phd/YefM family antitoxin [Cellulomonas sp. Sa3CUA2]|uniref:Antitoxin n=1 Tax=Cellulomonas avistercoris TaxID=2762242 RepID=A0ABR8QAN5_9CELL|nr:type II toxin-antitoxin system Phd/YefM family antitoxin [Cellulomonas avistercoris]MBD7917503.1 type II toxin-antitoxin system Phd/YefM family antitoxin [Cellulomonas avistercoris]